MLPNELGPENPDNSEDFVADHGRLRQRYAHRLHDRGVPNTEVAAAVAAARGRRSETIEQFADHVQVDPAQVEAAEAGHLLWEELPPSVAFAVRRN